MNKMAIQGATQQFSIEIMPRDARRIDDFRNHLPPGTMVYVAWPPKAEREDMIYAAAKLHSEGMTPVSHIVARRLESEEMLWGLIRELSERAEITRLLLLGGDPDTPAGPYPDAKAILQSGVLEAFQITAVDIAGFPEGHPVMTGDLPSEVLQEKIAAARLVGIEIRVVSQFVLDPKAVTDWHAQTYNRIADAAPLRIGIPGIVSTKRLLQVAQACGLSGSFSILRKGGLRLAQTAMSNGATGELVSGLAELVNTQDDVSGFHFYTFGNFEKTAAWACAVANGQFDLKNETIAVHALSA